MAATIRSKIKSITGFYDGMPFDEMSDYPDLDVFLAVRESLIHLHPAVEKILNGQKDITEAHEIIVDIIKVGNRYRNRLKDIINELRELPGHEDDRLESTSIHDGSVVLLEFGR